MQRSATLTEADRLMTICNSCRYCEGLCAVFPAMEIRRAFTSGDLNYFANLCHSCGACYVDCQFSPPHEFDVRVPAVLAKARRESYADYAWPRALAPLFRSNGLAIALITVLSIAAFILGFVALNDSAALFARRHGPGSFYALMPHNMMALLFGAAFLWAVVAFVNGARAFWNDIGEQASTLARPRPLLQAVRDAASLRYLDGGGVGCYNEDERPNDNRRLYHHLTFYGFLLCFASTSVATLYHYLLHREAPYPFWDLPVVLGTLGGLGIMIGPIGLYAAKRKRDAALMDPASRGMDVAFLAMLVLTGVTGLAVLLLRETSAMGVLLALHLGAVFALFITLPYGKFVHGLYRFMALVRYARERHSAERGEHAT
ncbi:tricarballylate utilization 4Fe-4S protein TcuB [Bradyrhizobium sp. BTAi1]|uniref:tricarballylate utilization 4Fe-4S protein TcuB n=1 Tax=Bradyrhizobium sp. (strain BTAi1 / ATCC BAA-1182) TaxID=288000 RepID=UPI00005DFED0|nr:tricarballylate utilization 4Fe-4S protein TcuB [Bradyrhizobium sp. BTAi1]ABQ36268.1 putative citrate utilization protein B (citB) [Bradyrhizobium sp. BTAi1]